MHFPSPVRALLLTSLALAGMTLAGCGGRDNHGMLFTSDGRMVSNNPENNRIAAQDNIRFAMDPELAPAWRSEVTILELPEFVTDQSDNGTWRWPKATVNVDLISSDLAVPRKLKDDEIRSGITDYMKFKVQQGKLNLVINIRERIGSAPAAKAIDTAAVGRTPDSGARTYIVQPGDTLADISSAFYGSPQHWRRIAEANPGIPAERLTTPGTTLVIPPPAAAPAPVAPAPAPAEPEAKPAP